MSNCHLKKDRSAFTFHKITSDLAIEIFKAKNNLAPNIVNDLFHNETENHYDLKYRRDFQVPFVNLVYHGNEGISYAGYKIWDIVPAEIKQINCLNGFKKSIKNRTPTDCILCRTYISGENFRVLKCS